MSDPTGHGYLDKQGLFLALRLIAVCQAGKDPAITNMALSDPPPKLAGVEAPPTSVAKWSLDVSKELQPLTTFYQLPLPRNRSGQNTSKCFKVFSPSRDCCLATRLGPSCSTLNCLWTL